MAAFQYQETSFLLDSLYLANTTNTKMPSLLEEGDINTCFSAYPSHGNPLVYNNSPTNEPLVTEKSKTDSSSIVAELHSDDQKETSVQKKRKNNEGSCLSSVQSQDMRGTKSRNQKKCSHKKDETEEKQSKSFKKDHKKVLEEPPTGYIHVRARRGQATDSHSLAERVRREKISERMKMLQGLVPGCDKVTGKALMLDEIINYVQSLQYQVEFLSMKLASVNPALHDFGTDLHASMIKPEKVCSSVGATMHFVQQPNLPQPSPTPTITTKSNYSVEDNAVSLEPQQGQMHSVFSQFSQDNENLIWNVYDQRQRLLNQCDFNNLCSFQ